MKGKRKCRREKRRQQNKEVDSRITVQYCKGKWTVSQDSLTLVVV
jgi:hypothetical protein